MVRIRSTASRTMGSSGRGSFATSRYHSRTDRLARASSAAAASSTASLLSPPSARDFSSEPSPEAAAAAVVAAAASSSEESAFFAERPASSATASAMRAVASAAAASACARGAERMGHAQSRSTAERFAAAASSIATECHDISQDGRAGASPPLAVAIPSIYAIYRRSPPPPNPPHTKEGGRVQLFRGRQKILHWIC